MKFNKILKVALISCCIVSLSACSAKHRQMGSNSMDMSEAQATGIGEGERFGSDGSGSTGSHRMAQKNTYYFDFDRSDIHEQDKPSIYANAEKLVSQPNKKVRVEGHTDPRGSREYNVALAERRANSVAELMKSKGVGSDQVRVVSYGAERLAAPGHTEEEYQLDRRAIID